MCKLSFWNRLSVKHWNLLNVATASFSTYVSITKSMFSVSHGYKIYSILLLLQVLLNNIMVKDPIIQLAG